MKFRLRLQPEAAAAVLRALAPITKRQVRDALRSLVEAPHNESGRLDVVTLKTKSQRPLFRLRVGEYRVVYRIDESQVFVAKIFHRRDGYGWLERLADRDD